MNFVYKKFDAGFSVAGLFFRFSRNFYVNLTKFVESKLYNIGFRGVFLGWIICFLIDRNIYVGVDNYWSKRYQIEHGVPQGSVHRSLLFLFSLNKTMFKNVMKLH